MKINTNYNKIEASKYKHSKILLTYFTFALINIFISSVIIYKRNISTASSDIMVFVYLHSFLFMQVLFLPLLISIITSKSVELEQQGNMLKVILTSGVSLNKIYNTKLMYILKSFTIYISAIWLIIIIHSYFLGFKIAHTRLITMFLYFLIVSYLLIIIHFNIAILTRKHILGLSIALLGSLTGFISLFFMKYPIIPYCWYAMISAIKFVNTGKNTFTVQLTNTVIYPIVASFILMITFYILGKKIFLRRNYD